MTERPYNRLTIPEQRAESRRRHEEKFGRRIYRCRGCRTIVDEQTTLTHLEMCAALGTGGLQDLVDQFFTVHRFVIAAAQRTPGFQMKRRRARGEEEIDMPTIDDLEDAGELDG